MAAREAASSNRVIVINRRLPIIKFSAKEYHELTDWSTTHYVSPPILSNVNNQELITKLHASELCTDWEFHQYLCHTVAVERVVKLVTELSKKVCGFDNRNNYIIATIESRKTLKSFNTKKEFLSKISA